MSVKNNTYPVAYCNNNQVLVYIINSPTILRFPHLVQCRPTAARSGTTLIIIGSRHRNAFICLKTTTIIIATQNNDGQHNDGQNNDGQNNDGQNNDGQHIFIALCIGFSIDSRCWRGTNIIVSLGSYAASRIWSRTENWS